MTRFIAFLSCMILVLGLCIGVCAADNTRATSVNILATVSSNGSCDVTTAVTLHLDTPQEKLVFPVPVNASNVTLNGKPILTEKTAQARLVDLSRLLGGLSGDFSFSVGYSVHNAVDSLAASNDAPSRLQLTLPMLAGFAFPIEQVQFSVNLPGNVPQDPSFVSGYHQADIEKDLTYSVSGASIAGRSLNALKDHETLTMYLEATEEMFPQTSVELPALEAVTPLIGILAGLALVFWIIFLRNYHPFRSFPAVAPEGFGAGQMGTVLAMVGADLNLMAFSWAQLGYLVLRMDRRGHVFLEKRMDMGNERTTFERKCFQYLFSRKDILDTSSTAYRRLVQSVRLQNSARQLFRDHRGPLWVKIFRGIAAVSGLLCGTCFGIVLGNLLDYGWFFILILSAAGLVCSWHIQFWADGVFLHRRSSFWFAVGLSVLWLILGLAIGQFSLALSAVAIQFAAGFLATFGGRRTEDGRNAMAQALRLRRHLTHLSVSQAQQLCHDNPEFFFDMAPYAIALGCDSSFARRFGKSRLPVCPYIQTSNARGLTAQQWSRLMRHILDGMSLVQKKKRPMDHFQSVMRNYMR